MSDLGGLEMTSTQKQSPHSLPTLTIPLVQSPPTTYITCSSKPETPASLSSPSTGIIDLTQHVTTLDESPVTAGGFSDIHRGEWTRYGSDDDEGERKIETVPVRFFLS